MMTIPPKTVAFSDSLSLSCMMFKILLPVISRGVSPHWVKSTPPNTDSSSSWTSRSKIKAPPPLHLHPPPGSTCRFSTSPQMLFEKKSEGTSILGWLRIANCHPTSGIASFQHEHHPSRSSYSLRLAPWNLRFGLFPWSGDPGALCSCQSPS